MKYRSGQGNVVHVDTARMIARGGEGTVYGIKGDRTRLAKVYHEPTAARGDKLRAMLAAPPSVSGHDQGHMSVAWPEDVLLDASGTVVGFVMPAASGTHSLMVVYHPRSRAQALPPGFDYRYLLRTAHNLCQAVAAIHEMGYVVGDLNARNVLVHGDARVTLIDCDSFQIGKHRCIVGFPEYVAPELQGAPLDTIDLTPAQDAFTLGILIHLLLMRGAHPYAGSGDPQALGERIAGGLCPYKAGGPQAPAWAPRLGSLSPSLQQLMRDAFVTGERRPELRPTAHEWARRLRAAEQELTQCGKNRAHHYFRHVSACPDCEFERMVQSARQAPSTSRPSGVAQAPLQPATRGWPTYVAAAAVLGTLAFVLVIGWPASTGRRPQELTATPQRPSRTTESSPGYVSVPPVPGIGARVPVGPAAGTGRADVNRRAAPPGPPPLIVGTAGDIYRHAFGEPADGAGVNAPPRPRKATGAPPVVERASDIYRRAFGEEQP